MSDLISMDKRDIIKAFRDYQKEWLYSHHDFELSTRLEEVIAKFLDDTAERFMVEKSQLLEEGTTKDATSNLIRRVDAIDIERRATVDTNPSHFYSHQKFEQFMNDVEISSFGRWQWSNGFNTALTAISIDLKQLPSAEPERLTDDDFETIRIHLNAHKEKLCNQQRWKESEEYQRIIDRFMAFASAKPDLQPTCNQLATDAISRQAAINAPVKMVSEGLEWIPVYYIKELPSTEQEIIRCKDCENWDTSWKPTTSSGKSHYCALKDGVWEPDDYCSRAERRQ